MQNTITQVEEQLALAVINKVNKNVYNEASEVIAEKDRQEQDRQLTNALLIFYSLVVPLQAKQVMQHRSQQYGKPGTFAVDATVRHGLFGDDLDAVADRLDALVPQMRHKAADETVDLAAVRASKAGLTSQNDAVGPVGLEPTTYGLKVRSSAN